MKTKGNPRVASGCECPRRRDLMHQPGCTKWGDLRPDEAAKPSPLPSPAPIPWKRGHDLGHAFQVVKSRHQNEWVIVAEAITAKDADLIVRAVNSHAAVMAKIKSIAKAHDRLSDAVEDPDGGNDAEHDAAVKLLGKLLDLYAALRAAGEAL